MAKEVIKKRRTKAEKRAEAQERKSLKGRDQLVKLNNEFRNARKEREKIAKTLGITLTDTFTFDYGGSKTHREKCVR